MSLFVGNVSRFVEQKDIEKEFRAFGECTVDFRGKFAFIQFKNDPDAEQAKKNLQGRELQGLKLNIEWSKKSGRFDENRNMTTKKSKFEEQPQRSRSRSHKRAKRNRSRTKSKSRSRSARNRSAPRYANSRSQSVESNTECPRDKILKKKIKEMKQAKKDKKAKEKEKADKEKKKDKQEKTDEQENQVEQEDDKNQPQTEMVNEIQQKAKDEEQ